MGRYGRLDSELSLSETGPSVSQSLHILLVSNGKLAREKAGFGGGVGWCVLWCVLHAACCIGLAVLADPDDGWLSKSVGRWSVVGWVRWIGSFCRWRLSGQVGDNQLVERLCGDLFPLVTSYIFLPARQGEG